MWRPETHYVSVEGASVAYQVVGSGDRTMLYLAPWASSMEGIWTLEVFVDFISLLSSRTRVVLVDQRGSGLSDRGVLATSVDEPINDMLAVLDAAVVDSAVIIAQDFTAPAALAFAARHPQRTEALMLLGPTARILAADDYAIGLPHDALEPATDIAVAGWGQAESAWNHLALPGEHHSRLREQAAAIQRQAVAPREVPALVRMCMNLDAREYLAHVAVPVLVIHRKEDRFVPASHGRWIAEHVRDGHYVELPGDNHYIWTDPESVIAALGQMFRLDAPVSETHLSAIVVTDIVESTQQAARLGPERWRRLLGRHDDALRRRLVRHRGTEQSTAGDSFLATFPSAANALAFALDACSDAIELGLQLRGAVHAGEVNELNESVHGIAVHVATRIEGAAPPGGVAVSSGIREALVGNDDYGFEALGAHDLKGVPGTWSLWRAHRS